MIEYHWIFLKDSQKIVMKKLNSFTLSGNNLDIKVASILNRLGMNQKIMEVLQPLQRKELSIVLIDLFNRRSQDVNAMNILQQMTQTRFCRSSNNNIRKINLIEAEIAKILPEEFDLIDVSPLDPFWLNSFLTETSQKKIISTSRGFDLMSDGSTKLALEWAIRRKELSKTAHGIREKVLLWTNIRCLRAQSYEGMNQKDTYAHFKVFASAILWKDIENRDFEFYAVDKTLRFYFELLRKLKNEGIISFDWLTIYLSDLRITERLFASILGITEEKELKNRLWDFRNVQIEDATCGNQELSLFDYLWLTNSSVIKSDKDIDFNFWKKHGFEKNLIFLSKIYQYVVKFEKEFQDLWIKFHIDLWRSTGVWHYSHLAIKGVVDGNPNLKFGLFDGGATNWSAKLTWDEKERIFVAGIWTDNMANYM